MACGLPVIACSGSGAAEVVQHGETGLLVAPRDVDGLVEALRRLLAEPVERAAMGQRARSYVEREADSRQCLRRMEAFYGTVADRVMGRR
jgi:glycosyltransferase involved in cell wall biosynthesis